MYDLHNDEGTDGPIRPTVDIDSECKASHPRNRRYLNPDTPISILIIGPSQNGKTTFINRLVRMSATDTDLGKEGDKNTKCTVNVKQYDLEVPTTDYVLVDRQNGREFDAPDIRRDEEQVLGQTSWKKMTAGKYSLQPVHPDAPYLKLRLYDTPGLDDSEGKDYENMEGVLTMLNELSQSKHEWERKLNAIVLVYNANNAFSHSFQNVIKHYHQCMPNLFGGLAVVNSHFDLATLNQKRLHLIRDKLLKSNDSARARIVKSRAETFQQLLGGDGINPTHFFLDSRPKKTMAYAELLSRNTVADIIMFWKSSKPMPITQMRLVKSSEMRAIDAKLQRGLQAALTSWSVQLESARQAATDREQLRSEIQQRKEELTNEIERCEQDISRWDNETQYVIRSVMTADQPTSAALFFMGTLFRQRIKNTLTIKEPDFYEFSVTTENSSKGRWTGDRWDRAESSWSGTYENIPGQSPNLLARSWTTNRVKYRTEIKDLRARARQLKASLAEKEVIWQHRFAGKDNSAPKSEADKLLEELVTRIETTKHLIEILGQRNPPIDIAFNQAARVRYSKMPRQVNVDDLFEYVRAAKTEINVLKSLRYELDGYEL